MSTMQTLDIISISGVYQIVNLINGKRYIGSSKNIKSRWKEHLDKLNKNKHYNIHLKNSWNKYGKENFKFEIIEECLENDLADKEQYWIDYYRSYERNYGYNLSKNTKAFNRGHKDTEESRNKKSLARRGDKNPNYGNGYKISGEKNKHYIKIDKYIQEKICEKYIYGFSIYVLAEENNVSIQKILSVLRDNNIKIRSNNESKNIEFKCKFLDIVLKKEIINDYINGVSFTEIYKKYDLGIYSLNYIFEEYNIKKRNYEEKWKFRKLKFGDGGNNSHNIGYKWINKDDKQTQVKPEELQKYLDQGWKLGFIINNKGEKNPNYGRRSRTMNKDGKNKMILLDEVENYLKDGWVFGQLKKKREKNKCKH
jgi:group I intron endonuclease